MRVETVEKSAAVVFLILVSSLLGAAQQSRIGNLVGNAAHGKALYQRYCIFCHGAHGDGAGDSAPYLDPKPRDFTKATFKCRSTPSGSLPLDSDLYETITRGIHASAMPSWKPLLRQERADLVAYVKTFSSRFQDEKPAPPMAVTPEPPASSESVKRGADLFQSLNCWQCHGKDGRGNGPSASSLTDSKGYAIKPFDLTGGTRLKCGDSDLGIFRDLVTGLDGTPMPSFTSALTPDQVWDVVHYIATLRETAKHHGSEPPAAPKAD